MTVHVYPLAHLTVLYYSTLYMALFVVTNLRLSAAWWSIWVQLMR